jgi:DNA invertase Pin-like site-specific DNA recombinase
LLLPRLPWGSKIGGEGKGGQSERQTRRASAKEAAHAEGDETEVAVTSCGIYTRVSTSKQESDNQLAQLREFARVMEWRVDTETIYVDKLTGRNSDRPEFQRMFQDASQRKFDVLLFWSLDRLSREGALETLQHLNRLTGYGVQWRSLTEQYLDSTGIFREAVISILAVVAKQERVRLSERTRAGLERARREGKVLGRPRVDVDVPSIRMLRNKGLSWAAISHATGIARATCQRALQT